MFRTKCPPPAALCKGRLGSEEWKSLLCGTTEEAFPNTKDARAGCIQDGQMAGRCDCGHVLGGIRCFGGCAFKFINRKRARSPSIKPHDGPFMSRTEEEPVRTLGIARAFRSAVCLCEQNFGQSSLQPPFKAIRPDPF
jgi:hypothetical protein